MTAYRYMSQWNSWTLRPIGSNPYLGEAEARERYETGGDAFEVIPEPDPVTGIPAWQMYVATVATASGDLEGIWGASRAAAAEAGLTTPLEALTLAAGETRTFPLAAYIPAGSPLRFAYALDPTTRPSPETALARLEVGFSAPRSTIPVDSSHRNACAILHPFQPSPTRTLPSSFPPKTLLRYRSQAAALGTRLPIVLHCRPLPDQIAATS